MKIVIIGAGNIATHYAKNLHRLGHQIIQIYNRTSANAKALADAVSAHVIQDIQAIDLDAEVYIIAVSDSHLPHLIEQLNNKIKGIVVHTSGALPLSILNKFERTAVIYPPQSLNKNIASDISQIPFAVEGSDKEVEQIVLSIASSFSEKSFLCNSQQRLALHVSAVFANNFSNALFSIAKSILDKENLDFELIKPIILETAQKVQNHNPDEVQTGPAVRNDLNTMNKHLKFLSYSNDLDKIYQLLSDFIIKRRQN